MTISPLPTTNGCVEKFAPKFVQFDDLIKKFIAYFNLIIIVIIHKFGIFAALPVLQLSQYLLSRAAAGKIGEPSARVLDILARVGAAELVMFSAEQTPEPGGLGE